jgi:SAM domain (Sterile alpha motif)
VSEIRNWLDGIGLGQYAGAFEANDFDLDLLGQVSESGNALRACARSRAQAAGKVLGTARRDEHGAALTRSGKAGRGP